MGRRIRFAPLLSVEWEASPTKSFLVYPFAGFPTQNTFVVFQTDGIHLPRKLSRAEALYLAKEVPFCYTYILRFHYLTMLWIQK